MKKKNSALILGAGPTGLITAWRLLQEGWKVRIIEKNSNVGGLCRSWSKNNFILDTGPHIFHTPDESLKKFWQKNFGDLLTEGKFWCKNVQGEDFQKFYDYPLSRESLNLFEPKLKKKIKKELRLCNKNDKRSKAKSYREYIDSFIGPTLRKMFFEKYPEKIWGISTKKMTPDWAPNRIKFRDKILPFYHEEYVAVGKYGTGSIYERIRDKIILLGGKINLQEQVTGLKSINNKISEVNTNKRKYILKKNEILISTLPISLTARFLGKNNSLKYRGICSVYLFYKKKNILPKNNHWLYFDSKKVLFNRITENKKLSKYLAPSNSSFLTLEITYSQGDKFSKAKPNTIIEKVKKQIELTNLVNNKDLIDVDINYEPFVYPVQFNDYKMEVAKIKSFVESFDNLFSIGAGGEFNYADSQIIFHKSFDLVNSLVNKYGDFVHETKKYNSTTLNKTVKIGSKFVGKNNKPFIIAEAGLNHNGSLEIAKRLIDLAKKSNCDAIKFQSFLPNTRVSKFVKTEKYVEKIIGTQESIGELFQRLSLNFNKQKKIFSYAKKKKIMIFSTPFDFKSVDYLNKLDVPAFKIASADLVNIPLIKYVAKTKKPMIISTGMSKLSEIDDAVEAVKSEGNQNLILLHCNSSYPSTYAEMNLKFIETLKYMYDIPVGLSDHTQDLLASKISILRGANVIEKHFTLDKKMEGPDHILSADFKEMIELVKFKRNYHKWESWMNRNSKYKKDIILLLGDGIKKIQPNEYLTINSQKKSLYALKHIKKGQKFTKKNISIKGPVLGLMPKYFDILIGKTCRSNLKVDQPITWDDV